MTPIKILQEKFDHYMHPPLMTLRWVGLYPFEKKTTTQKVRRGIFFFFVVTTTIQLVVGAYMALGKTLLEVIDKFGIFAATSLGIVKFLLVWNYEKTYHSVIHKLRHNLYEDNVHARSDNMLECSEEPYKFAAMMTKVLFATAIICETFFAFSPLMAMSIETLLWKRPLRYILPLNTYLPGVSNYYLRYCEEFVGILAVVNGYLACEMLLMALMTQVYIHLYILNDCLKNLVKENNRIILESSVSGEQEFEEENKLIYERLSGLIKQHIDIVAICDEFSPAVSPAFLLNFFMSSIFICFGGFTLIMVDDLHVQIKFTVFVYTMLVITFDNCYYGQLLTDLSNEITNSIYYSDWYLIHHNLQRTICIMIHRTQKPMILSGMGYVDMNFETFSRVMGTAWSWFTLLSTVYEP